MDNERKAVYNDFGLTPPPTVVEDPGENDVLFGRGAPFMRWKGNVRFREFVNTRKAEYLSTRRHADKHTIAREIIDFIRNERNGRFLVKADPSGSFWMEANESMVVEKVKQALRDKLSRNREAEPPKVESSWSEQPSHPSQLEVSSQDDCRKQEVLAEVQQISLSSIPTSLASRPASVEPDMTSDLRSGFAVARPRPTIPRPCTITARNNSECIQQVQTNMAPLNGLAAYLLSSSNTYGMRQQLDYLQHQFLQQLFNQSFVSPQSLPAEIPVSQVLQSLNGSQIQAIVDALTGQSVRQPRGADLISGLPPLGLQRLQSTPVLASVPSMGVLGQGQDLLSLLIASSINQGTHWLTSDNTARPFDQDRHVNVGFLNSNPLFMTSSTQSIGRDQAQTRNVVNRVQPSASTNASNNVSLERLLQSTLSRPEHRQLLRLLSTGQHVSSSEQGTDQAGDAGKPL